MKPFKGKSAFAETLRTLNRLSSSHQRCQWKSGAEMIFPILYSHLTFTSHRCWTVYVKKAIFQAAESWRLLYGEVGLVFHGLDKLIGEADVEAGDDPAIMALMLEEHEMVRDEPHSHLARCPVS